MEKHIAFMREAIQEAKKAHQSGCYQIGAVIVKNGEVIARGSNRVKIDNDPTLHAEIVAIQEAARLLSSRHLENCVLYTTHEPCPMCASAAIWARLDGIVSGATIEDMRNYRQGRHDKISNWSWRTIDISARKILENGEPKLFLIEEVLRKECQELFHS